MIGGNVTEKITPETYEKMNKEFEEHGLAFRIKVPTQEEIDDWQQRNQREHRYCLLYTSPSPRDRTRSRMPSSA